MSGGSKLSAIASAVLIIAFFMPWVRACEAFDLSGYDLARDTTGAVENAWLYWLWLIVPAFTLIFALVRKTAAGEMGAATVRLVAGLLGLIPLMITWNNAQRKIGAIEILYGGWMTILGYVGIILSFFVDLSPSPQKDQPGSAPTVPSEEPTTADEVVNNS